MGKESNAWALAVKEKNEKTISRHAKRRMKLYSIKTSDTSSLLNHSYKTKIVGRHEIVEKLDNFPYPIKALFEVRKNDVFVITCNPLKRAKNEN